MVKVGCCEADNSFPGNIIISYSFAPTLWAAEPLVNEVTRKHLPHSNEVRGFACWDYFSKIWDCIIIAWKLEVIFPGHFIYEGLRCPKGWCETVWHDNVSREGIISITATDLHHVEKKDITFTLHYPNKGHTSLSIMRYRILTELIESHVSLPDDIIYNNVNKSLQFQDLTSLRKYHDFIYSEVNVSFQDQKFEKESLAYPTDTPPSSLSIAMAIMMHQLYDRCPNDSHQCCELKPLVIRSFTAASTLDNMLVHIIRKISTYCFKIKSWGKFRWRMELIHPPLHCKLQCR